ncbi:MAG: hypothetical protein AAB493_01470, partial [Patescibacteria group bacterium]
SKATEPMKEFMRTDATQMAIKLGLYNPNDPSGAESAMLWKGSTLSFDEHEVLSIHDIRTGEDYDLISPYKEASTGEVFEKYHGKMFDSDDGARTETQVENIIDDKYAPPAQINPETGLPIEENNFVPPSQENPTINTPIDSSHISPEIKNDNKIPEQVNPITGEPINTSTNAENLGVVHNLTPELLEKINQTYESNIHHMFPDEKSMGAWNEVKNSTSTSAEVIINMNADEVKPEYQSLISELHKLKEITGLKPIGESPINLAETPNEYIMRAMQKAAEMGNLDKIRL